MAALLAKQEENETEGNNWGPGCVLSHPALPCPDPLVPAVPPLGATDDSAALSAPLSSNLPCRAELAPESDSLAMTLVLAPPPVASTVGGAGALVSVAFPGLVTHEGCFHFTCKFLKHVLYQRQQLPLPYEQLACFSRLQLLGIPRKDEDVIRKVYPRDPDNNKKCQQVLGDLERVFQHLEIMFSLTLVPRSAKESLQSAACVRKLFHSLFLADVFSDLRAVPTLDVIVMVQGHRNCGIDWFNYKVPTRGRKLTVNLSCRDRDGATLSSNAEGNTALNDYIWFQAPVTVKGFRFVS